MALMQSKSYAERFAMIPPLDLMTMVFIVSESCNSDKKAVKIIEQLKKRPSPHWNLTLTELETYTKICVQEGVIPKEPYEECIKIRGKLFELMLEYGEDDII